MHIKTFEENTSNTKGSCECIKTIKFKNLSYFKNYTYNYQIYPNNSVSVSYDDGRFTHMSKDTFYAHFDADKINEGWKQFVVGGAIALSSLFGSLNAKAQQIDNAMHTVKSQSGPIKMKHTPDNGQTAIRANDLMKQAILKIKSNPKVEITKDKELKLDNGMTISFMKSKYGSTYYNMQINDDFLTVQRNTDGDFYVLTNYDVDKTMVQTHPDIKIQNEFIQVLSNFYNSKI